MPLPAYRNRSHRRDRTRIGLLLSSSSASPSPATLAVLGCGSTRATSCLQSQRSKTTITLLALTSMVVVYSYAFFGNHPLQSANDRSFAGVYALNTKLQNRAKRRKELIKRKRKGDHSAMVELEEMDREGIPEWQLRMQAGAAGELVWKEQQESWLGIGEDEFEEEEPIEQVVDKNNLRGGSDGKKDAYGDNKNQQRRRRRNSADESADFMVMLTVFVLTRFLVRVCAAAREIGQEASALANATTTGLASTSDIAAITTAATPSRSNSATTNTNNINTSGRAALARLMVPQSIHAHAALLRNARFRAWVTQLNRERAQNGQPPLSMESLRTVLRESDFSGNDYEALLRFNEEATLAQSLGATQAEIDRCPQRVLESTHDDLLATTTRPDGLFQQESHEHPNRSSSNAAAAAHQQCCPICLEAYQLQDRVRTIPCFHEFHVDCIDPWLAHKSVCPVCKHPVVGS